MNESLFCLRFSSSSLLNTFSCRSHPNHYSSASLTKITNDLLCGNPMDSIHSSSQFIAQQQPAGIITLSFLCFPLAFGIPVFCYCFPPLRQLTFILYNPYTPIYSKNIRFHQDLFLKLSSFSLYVLFPGILIYFKGIKYYLYHRGYISFPVRCSHVFIHVTICSFKTYVWMNERSTGFHNRVKENDH